MSGMVRQRLVSAGILFLLVFSWSTRAYCPMEDCRPQTSQERPHGCHGGASESGTVVQANTSNCCHAQIESDPPATAKSPSHALGPLVTAVAFATPVSQATSFVPSVPGRFDGHSPPLTILRI
jgi:hypothetical protein